MGFLRGLEASLFGQTGVGQYYYWILATHGLGLAILVGLVLVISLRVLGFGRGVSINALRDFIPVMWVGFILNLLSGLWLYAGNATILTFNRPFQLKILSIVLGGVVIWMLDKQVLRPAQNWTADTGPSGTAKALAAAAIGLWWVSVILSGRLIAYIT